MSLGSECQAYGYYVSKEIALKGTAQKACDFRRRQIKMSMRLPENRGYDETKSYSMLSQGLPLVLERKA